MSAPDAELDRLYAAPLEQFTAERDRLAAELRRNGDPERAQEVKRARKPSIAAWAVNQATRGNRERAAELLEAGDALRRAQESLAGRKGREAMQAARRRERDLVRALRQEAERALADAGRPASAAVREQIEQTLHAAVLDRELGELVAAGRLEQAQLAVGFPDVEPASRSAQAPDDDGGGRKREAIAKRLQRERERLAEATRKREAAEAAQLEAERAAAAAAKELDRAAKRVRTESRRESELGERVEQLLDELDAAGE